MSKVSDFTLSASAIRQLCRHHALPFIDVDIAFDDKNQYDGVLHIGSTNSLPHTLYNIVAEYCDKSHEIYNKNFFENNNEKSLFLLHFAATIRHLKSGSRNFEESCNKSLHLSRIYGNALVWNVLKNVVCPLNGIGPKNLLLVSGSAHNIDIAKFYQYYDVYNRNLPEEDFIFINNDFGNPVARSVFLLVEAVRGHGLSPEDVFKNIFESSIYDKLFGAVKLSYDKDVYVDEFFSLLMKILDFNINDFPHLIENNNESYDEEKLEKQAQWYDTPYHRNNPQWWFFGLPEKMLEPTRGADWSVYQNLEPWVTDFWDEVEEIEEKKNQGEGIPFNLLLRLKEKDLDKQDPNLALQELLKEQRIWQ